MAVEAGWTSSLVRYHLTCSYSLGRLDGFRTILPGDTSSISDHQIAATLFLRLFKTGDAVALESHLATLGPPCSAREILQRAGQLDEAPDVEPDGRAVTKPTTRYGRLLGLLRRLTDLGRDELSALDIAPNHFVPFNVAVAAELFGETERLDGRLAYWVGDWASIDSWRERRSSTLTNDYFGATESRAYLRALYERTVGAALDALNEHGFDIARYRDKSGRLQIHAEKIDNLMVGESVVIHSADLDTERAARTTDMDQQAAT